MVKAATKSQPQRSTAAARLKSLFYHQIAKELQAEFKLKNIHEVPRLEKIVLNVGLGKSKEDKKALSVAENTLAKISGQRPIYTAAKNSIASFKLREGQKIGLKVTLRGARMYEFMDRLINIVLPRLRDFHGVKLGAFDASGNYHIGLPESSVFPELTFDDTANHGLQVNLVIDCLDKAHAQALLSKFGMPFEKEAKKVEEEAAPPPEALAAMEEIKAQEKQEEVAKAAESAKAEDEAQGNEQDPTQEQADNINEPKKDTEEK